jgi:hypothetical protein
MLVWLLLLFSAVTSVCAADEGEWDGPTLRARLIVASDTGRTEQVKELQDVLPLLEDNLRYRSYRMIARRRVAFRSDAELAFDKPDPKDRQSVIPGLTREDRSLLDKLSLVLTDVEDSAAVVVFRREKRNLLRVKLRLRAGRPVVLGALPVESDKMILVIDQPVDDSRR